MARVEAITSEDLVYQVTLTGRTIGRDTEEVWTGLNTSRRPFTPFEPRGVDKVMSGGTEFVNPDIRFTAANGRLNYSYGLICYDFRTNNEGRRDSSGRPKKRMNNVRRIESAELTFQVSAVAFPSGALFYIACLPKISLVSIRGMPVPHPLELGMNYFLGYNEVYRNPINGQLVQDRLGSRTSGNINPACFAGRSLRDGERPPPVPLVLPIELTRRDSYPATVTVKLKPRMLRALELAMRNGDVFGLAAVPVGGFGDGPEQFVANTGLNFWNGTTAPRRDVTFGGKIRSGLEGPFDPPVLRYKYTFNNNKINTGAGISRTSTSGFMEGDVFAGTNSGFSS